MGLTVTQLVIPKFHGEKLVDIPDEQLAECLVCTLQRGLLMLRADLMGYFLACSKEDCEGYWCGEL